jgi:glycosyltransferase involved in cell wall biosynthesis
MRASGNVGKQEVRRRGGKMFSSLMRNLALPRDANIRISLPGVENVGSPSVSVVIPCYNYGHYLSECVASVLGQEHVRVDVLVVDDASPDGSADVARRLAAGDDRVHVICHQINQGHIATYNEGLAKATGDYVVLLSADDRLTPGCLARATSLMEAHPSVGLTYGFAVDFTDSGIPPARTVATRWIIWEGQDWIAHCCKAGRNFIRSPEAVVRTSVLREIGGYRDDLPHSGDLEWWMRAATVSDVGYVAGADQAYYRFHSSNMHSSADLLTDVSERFRAFGVLFAERSESLAEASAMYNAARRTLAREALGHAMSAYASGSADLEQVDDYVEFALKVWPDARNSGALRTLQRLRQRNARPRRDPSLISHEAIRRLNYSVRWWRWRWVGVD